MPYERAMAGLTPVFDEILDEYKKPLQRDILRRLADRENIYSESKHPNEVKRAVDQLLLSGVIEKEKRGRYRFVEPMLQKYILRNYELFSALWV